MERFLTLTALLVTMFVIAACGGGGSQGSERAVPSEAQQTQTESAPKRVPEETAQEEPPPQRSPAEAAQENARRSEESSGLRVTTIEGEEVMLGAQGDVTALFFMAGW
jgi:hypothetical protein